MTPTRRLYDEDSFLVIFTANVLSCEKTLLGEREVYDVILDQTAFFPEAGGQSSDKGILGSYEVSHISIDSDQIIHHYLRHSFVPGDTVQGQVYWDQRFSNMQQHTGEHIFSGLVHRFFHYNNVGFHLGSEFSTMDFDGPLSPQEVDNMEYEANVAICRDVPIRAFYPTEEELSHLKYRSKKEIEGPIRIVDIEGYDTCACCAPHLNFSSQVGILKVINQEAYKGGTRISFLCGIRALQDYKKKYNTAIQLSHLFSVPTDFIDTAATELKNDRDQLRQQLAEARREILEVQIASLPRDKESACIFCENQDTINIRVAVNHMTELFPGYCGIFNGNDTDGYQFILGSATYDCNILLEKMQKTFSAKGGGTGAMAQGMVQATAREISGFFA